MGVGAAAFSLLLSGFKYFCRLWNVLVRRTNFTLSLQSSQYGGAGQISTTEQAKHRREAFHFLRAGFLQK